MEFAKGDKVFDVQCEEMGKVDFISRDGDVYVDTGHILPSKCPNPEQFLIPLSQVLAAPAMYKALKELTELVASYSPASDSVVGKVFAQAKAAIAAAEEK